MQARKFVPFDSNSYAEAEYDIFEENIKKACQAYIKSSYALRMRHHSTAVFAIKFIDEAKVAVLGFENEKVSMILIKLSFYKILLLALENFLQKEESKTFSKLLEQAKEDILRALYINLHKIDKSLNFDNIKIAYERHYSNIKQLFPTSITQLNNHLAEKAKWFASTTSFEKNGFKIFEIDVLVLTNPAELAFSDSYRADLYRVIPE